MTQEILNELKRLMEKATDIPWETDGKIIREGKYGGYIGNMKNIADFPVDDIANVEFVVSIVNATHDLIRTCEAALKMREELGKMEYPDCLEGDHPYSIKVQNREIINHFWRIQRDAIVSNFDKEVGV